VSAPERKDSCQKDLGRGEKVSDLWEASKNTDIFIFSTCFLQARFSKKYHSTKTSPFPQNPSQFFGNLRGLLGARKPLIKTVKSIGMIGK
jgi:hypothetical protein